MDIKVDIIKKDLSNIDMGLICDIIYDKYNDFTHYLFECVIGKNDVPVDYLYELNELLYEHSKCTLDNHYRDWALAMIDKLNVIIDKYCIREGEAAEYENEIKGLPAVKKDYEPKYIISYLITVYYADGHSEHHSFIGCAEGLVFNFKQNNLNLDAPERGLRTVFNMFTFPEPEKIVACDLSYELVEDFPF